MSHVFDLFTKMMRDLPSKAIIKAVDLECRMLEQDEEAHRVDMTEDALSILSFGQFIRMAKDGGAMHRIQPLPPDHIELYKNTIVRLVQAGELPESTMEKFDFTFVSMTHLKMP